MRATLFCFGFVLTSVVAQAQLSEPERQGIRDALSIGNMRESDLDFARRPFSELGRIPLIDEALDHPLAAADRLMALHASAEKSPPSVYLQRIIEQVFEQSLTSLQHDPPLTGLESLPADLRGPILGLVNWINSANNEIKRATAELTPLEKRSLIESLPVWAVEEPKVSFSFVKSKPLAKDEMLRLLAKVDLARIRSASARLMEAVWRASGELLSSKSDIDETIRIKIGGMPIVIAGRKNDLHADTDAVLTIDLGGDDTYTGRHGAGVGYAGVLIDIDGSDVYRVGDLNVGAAVLGIGIAVDWSGREDTFVGGSLTFGAGLAGVGVQISGGGHDSFRSVALSQGYGQYGIGLLVDGEGNENYDLSLFGQGAARTEGVGWLIDEEGRDEYRAGGLALNSPLFATAHYSFAQGFGMGYREDTGGIGGGVGLLTDLKGDDVYIGETYQQAASYWYAVGSLFDGGGNDTYTGHHYCQSSAMHACAAFLFDMGGDDGYLVKVGAAHAIGHDYGVAVLLDRQGDDIYTSRDSTPGIGNANGLGLFIDGDGTDRYYGPPGKGNGARGTGSLGVFVDLNGSDDYRQGLRDASASTTPTWGVALDRPTLVVTSGNDPVSERQRPVPGSLPMPSTEEMALLYAKAVQWGVGTAQQEVVASLDALVAIGGPALQWMLDNRLAIADRLHVRAFVHVVRALGDDGSRLVGAKAFRAKDSEMGPLLRIATDAGVSDFGAVLPGLFSKPAIAMQAVVAAGTLKAVATVPHLMSVCRSDDRLLVRAAMVSLEQIADPSSAGTAQAMLLNEDLMTRKAALSLLAKFEAQALSTGDVMTKSPDEFRCRIGLEILGRIGSGEALARVGAFLRDSRPGVRIEAALQLAGRCPQDRVAEFLSLKTDRDSLVRSAASGLEPGGKL